MDKVLIIRNETGENGTFGKLTVAPAFECYTLERPATGDHPCIPAGTYKVAWTKKPIHGDCYEIMNVKNRTAILIHSANWWDQLLGCVAPGRAIREVEGKKDGVWRKMKGVSSSRDALDGMIAALEKKDFELTISWAAGVAPDGIS